MDTLAELALRLIVICAAAASPIGCSAEHQPPTAGVDAACEQAAPSAQQLTGDWTDAGEIITTLDVDGTLKSSGGNKSGTWAYAPWANTPGKRSMPAGQEHRCVLWLHWQSPAPPMDLVYVPLIATNESVELSYVGRGNTLHWTHPKPST